MAGPAEIDKKVRGDDYPWERGDYGERGDYRDALVVRVGARTQGLMRHGPVAWTPGTFWTVGNDAMDAGDSLGAPPGIVRR
jgi:hypothetical protein